MSGGPGKPENLTQAGKGRPAGTPNKVTQSMREAYREAFDKVGGAEALAEWGMQEKNRTAFYQLTAKLIPLQIAADVKGALEIVHKSE